MDEKNSAAFDLEFDDEDTVKIPDLAWLTDVSSKTPEPKAKRKPRAKPKPKAKARESHAVR